MDSALSRQAAPWSAVSPYLFTALTLAPSSRQSLTAAKPPLSVERVIPGSCPTHAATIRGVVPSVALKEVSAPCVTNSLIASRSFARAQSRNGVAPHKLHRVSELHMYCFTL